MTTDAVSAPPVKEAGYVQLPGWGFFGGDGSTVIAGDELEDVPELRWPNSVITYHRMRNDAQIDALQSSIVLPISRLKWSIDPDGAADEVVEDICTNLNLPRLGEVEPPPRTKRGSGFDHSEHLPLALLAPTVYGHMPFELIGDIDPDTLAWQLKELGIRLPQTLSKINVNTDGSLASITQGGNMIAGMYTGTRIDASALAMYVWKREGGNWTGRSMLRPLYKHWILKDRLLRIDAIKNERYGAGIPVGTAAPGGDPAQYQRVAAATRASENGGVGMPNGGTLSIEGIKGTLPDTLGSIRYQDEAMARSFLAMFIQLGTTETGSRALGEQFVNFFVDALAAFANWYAATTTRDVITRIVDWNHGEDVLVPKLVWEQKDEEPLGVDDLANLVKSGALVVDEEMQGWIRNKWNMPKYSGDAPLPTKPATPIQINPGGTGDPVAPQSSDPAPVVAASQPVHAHADHDQSSHGNRGGADAPKKAKPATTQQADDDVEEDEQPSVLFEGTSDVAVAENLPDGTEPDVATVTFMGSAARRFLDRMMPNRAASSQTINTPATIGHREPTAIEVRAATDFSGMQSAWEKQATDLVSSWEDIQAKQIDALIADIEKAVDAGDDVALATLTAPVLGQELLLTHMTTMATTAIAAAKAEAKAQAATVADVGVADISDALASRANGLAALLGRSISDSASRNALLRYGTGISGKDVGAGVREQLNGLSNSFLNDTLGGAMTQAQNSGRRLVFTNAEGTVSVYSSELLDENTCDECEAIDGTKYASQADADADYPAGGYAECAGGPRCRGTEVAVYGEGE